MYLILFIILILLLLGSVPAYGYSANWGYYPSGTILVILVILFLFYAFGRNHG